MRRSKKGKSAYTRIGVWRDPSGTIHMTLEGVKGGHVAINSDPEKRNGHPTLYRRLDQLLRDAPAPRAQRLQSIQVRFVARDGTVTDGPKFKLPSSI